MDVGGLGKWMWVGLEDGAVFFDINLKIQQYSLYF